ncbi:MAG: PhoU domain-containing protein, partial [Clostridia bacterium]|nr:PhoU domain-containing protein [Clostridia bacterium]
FHTLFNLFTTLILLPFTNVLVYLAKKIIPEKKGGQEEKHRLTYIDNRLLETPPIAVANTKKEIIKMAEIAKENINLAMDMLLECNLDNQELLKDNEDALNFLNKSITKFLTKVMAKDVNRSDEKALGSYYHVVVDIERVGDYAVNIMEYTQRLKNEDASFSEEATKELREVKTTINSLFENAIKAFEDLDSALLSEIDVLEESVDQASVELESRHIERIKKGLCDPQVGSIFLQTVSNLERVGDHITNIAFSIKNYRHH